jgi:Uma2 family endonuclease
MGMPAETTRRWTAREVRDLIAAQPLYTPRYELVDGELLVTPSPAPSHQIALRQLILAVGNYLERESVAEVLHSPSDVELEPEDVRQPDVFVVSRAELERVVRDGNPVRELLLAIEVLSPSSGRHDRVRKRPGYQRRVPEYWIVDLESRLVERWRRDDDRPEILTEHISWHPSGAAEPFRMTLPPFFARAFAE